jgi:DNA-binding HxlR family transcriptional regulator
MLSVGRSDTDIRRYVESLAALGRHPNTEIVRALLEGPRRFNELAADLANVPEPALSGGLRELDADGIVFRRVDPGPPLRVLYGLTAVGLELGSALDVLWRWSATR